MRIAVVGEGMLELSQSGPAWRLGHGGDTLNTAIHLARFGADVAYVTALGDDPFSDQLRSAWADEGVDVSLILTDPDRRPGLYAITTDAAGERSFTYWRGESAARRLFALPNIACVAAAIEAADVLLFSLISLAILPPEGRAALFDLCRSLRARGGRVAFDTNYRPRLWATIDEARSARSEALALTDIGLPTIEDELALCGAQDAAAVGDHWRAAGVGEVVVKLGAAGCMIDGAIVPAPKRLTPVDTSGAGDAFNAGYLHARLAGQSLREAALAGHRVAGWVIMQPGAVPPASPAFRYADLA
jgi:2-dehydro-3-deoxygluconokinase